ncbi:hypothetical protein DBL01_07975 [Acinetobacter pittii]|nr:hypothetical protein DBL01_07975 [Acinetobacter pittii]
MVVERKRVDRLDLATSTRERVPLPPYHREKGGTKVPHGKYLGKYNPFAKYGLSKPSGNVGQQRNINRYNKERQFILMKKFKYNNLINVYIILSSLLFSWLLIKFKI